MGQFHIGTFGRLKGPLWFYLVLVALMAFLYGGRNRLGYWTGGLILLGAVVCAVQETRRRRGVPLANIGWWTVTAALLALASGLLFVADGAVNGNRESLALGLTASVVLIFTVLFLTVLKREEENGKKRNSGRKAGFRTILIALVVLGLACLAAFLYLTWRIQGLEADLARFYGDIELMVRDPGLAANIQHGMGCIDTARMPGSARWHRYSACSSGVWSDSAEQLEKTKKGRFLQERAMLIGVL